jgi:regulator of protease activity HflC (stomatin/prohibitin superfamily)
MEKNTIMVASVLMAAILVALGVFGFIFLGRSISAGGTSNIVWTVVFLGIFIIFFLARFRSIPQEERMVIESFGKFFGIWGPGLIWLCPIFVGIRKSVSVSEQRSRLYEPGTDHAIIIDFKDGSAAPVRAFVFWQISGGKELLEKQANKENITAAEIAEINKKIFEFVYAGVDVERFLVTTVENATRSYLNSYTIDEGITMGKAGYNIFNGIEKTSPEEAARIKEIVNKYGLALPRVTIGDFELSKETIDARNLVMQMGKEAEAVKNKSKTMATRTMGARLEAFSQASGIKVEDIQKILVKNPDLMAEFMKVGDEMLMRQLGYEAKARHDWGVDGATGVEKVILNAISALKLALDQNNQGGQKNNQNNEKPIQEGKEQKTETDKDEDPMQEFLKSRERARASKK